MKQEALNKKYLNFCDYYKIFCIDKLYPQKHILLFYLLSLSN